MHDRYGKELKIGDQVMIPAIISELHNTEEFCNVTVTTLFGRRPDDQKERICAINTGVLVRASNLDFILSSSA